MAALYSHTTRADGITLTAAIYNADHQNHINNGVPSQLDDYSTNTTEMRTTTDPGEVSSESLATSMAGEFERLRFAIAEMKRNFGDSTTQVPQWYSSLGGTPGTIGVINEAGADFDFRMESDTQTHMFFMDGGNNAIGIGSSVVSFASRMSIVGPDDSLGVLAAVADSVNTTTPNIVASLYARTSGTAAAGFGGMLTFLAEEDAGANQEAGRLGFIWTSAAAAGPDGAFVVMPSTNAVPVETMRVNDLGKMNLSTAGVTHGVTAIAPTNTYARMEPVSDSNGGARLIGLADTAGTIAAILQGISPSVSTTASTSAAAYVMTFGAASSGTDVANCAANELVFGARARRGGAFESVFLVDEDGDMFNDGASGTSTTYDEWDDVALCRAFDLECGDPATLIRDEFDQFINYNRDALVRAGIITDPKDGGRPMWCTTNHIRLLNGAMAQMHRKVRALEAEVARLALPA